MRSKIFIGSSSEGLRIAQSIQVLLDKSCEVTIWSQGVFGLSQGTLESLVSVLDKFDFAILILTPDDMTTSREQTLQSPRDNVLFELGLFVGGLGRNRTFIIYDRSKQIKIPSDLAGITPATFQEHSDGNLYSSLGSAATLIQSEVERLGTIKSTPKPQEFGALNVIILNGDIADNGWTLKIDSDNEEKYIGKTAGRTNLTAGHHLIKIEAWVNEKPVQIVKIVTIPAGSTCEETFTF